MELSAAFFDFDGVIVDSVSIKTIAYQELFKPFGDRAVDLITEHHLAHLGVDRHRKIRFVLDKLAVTTRADPERLAAEFAALVVEKVINAKVIPAAAAIIDTLRDRNIDMHIVSGTPEIELKEILKRKELDEPFKSVNGAPATKSTILRRIIGTNAYNPGQCVMFGDAQTDFDAAQACGIWFAGFPPNAVSLDEFPFWTKGHD